MWVATHSVLCLAHVGTLGEEADIAGWKIRRRKDDERAQGSHSSLEPHME